MKIVKFEAENVKRIKAVSITPDPADPLVIIRGDNGAGKSSCLDAIVMALGGKGVQPTRPIREGETHAHVVVELDDLVVTRRWTANDKSELVVTNKEGLKFPKPQAKLDDLVGRLSFDPLSFLRLEPKAQLETVREALGLDFTAIDQARAAAYSERTLVNRELERARAQLAALPVQAAVVVKVDVAQLLAEQTRLLAVQKASEAAVNAEYQAKAALEAALREHTAGTERVKRAREALAQEEAALSAVAEKGKAARAALEQAEKVVASAEDVDLDLLTVRDRLAAAESVNAAARKFEDRASVADQVAKLYEQSAALSATITKADETKQAQLAAAKFPIPGVAFGELGLVLNGVPFEQASQAEQLAFSVALGIAGNPKLRALFIRDGSLLDKKNLKLLGEFAAKADLQCFIEVVGKGDGKGFVIEDGGVESFS